MSKDEVTLTIDGKQITVPKGTTVYTATQMLGINVPIFCYQDRMPPFGACRVCLVEVEKMPKLQTSCTLVATEGMVVKTQSEMAVKGREGILEFLLINHPLDCPICDRGGECPLQEQTLSHGPGESRFYEDKRRFKKPLPLGPVLMLDRERCIVCARCTRFGDIIAGDHALEFIERGYKTEVGTPHGGPVESKFIGNTIMICPVGALTSQVYRFRARPWDNQPTESTCSLCPVGCSMIIDERDGEIMRTRSRENKNVNDIWMCDKGWFGYEFTYHPERLATPLIRRDGKLEPASWDEALMILVKKFGTAKATGRLGALGGNPLTVEENFLFQRLFREGAGVNHVDYRVGMPIFSLNDEGMAPGMENSIGECEQLTHAYLLGLDLTEEFPVIWLRLKQAINRGAKVVFLGHYAPEISYHLDKTVLHAPGQELEMIRQHIQEGEGKGAIFAGSQYLASKQRKAILSELLKFSKLTLNIMEGRNNSCGARYAGMHPELGPCGKKLQNPGLNALEMLSECANNSWDLLYVAGANPAKKFPSDLWQKARAKLGCLVVQDLFLTETAQQADVVLPTLSYVEKGGSFINIEGRVQTLLPGKSTPQDIYSDAEIFTILSEKLNVPLEDASFNETLKSGRIAIKQIYQLEGGSYEPEVGSLKAVLAPALFDEGVRMKHNSHVSQLIKEPRVRMHHEDGAQRGIKNGDKIQIGVNGNKFIAKVKLDSRMAKGVLVLPNGFDQIPIQDLNINYLNGMAVEVWTQS